MICLVTGATGFIGRALCAALRHRGDEVRAYSRTGIPLPDGTPTIPLDLATERLGLADLRGVDVVFHLAGVAHQRAPAGTYQSINLHASLALADACLCAGVGHFVFVSSVKAMGRPPDDTARSEEACVIPLDDYGRSKWEAEQGLRELCRGRMSLTVVRPALVYGARSKGNLALLDSWIRRGLPRPPADGARSMIALDDLTRLLCALSERPGLHSDTFIASGDTDYSTRDIYDLLRRGQGRGEGVAWCPRWAWYLAARCLDLLRPGEESTWNRLFGTERYCNGAVKQATGWQPALGLSDVIGGGRELP